MATFQTCQPNTETAPRSSPNSTYEENTHFLGTIYDRYTGFETLITAMIFIQKLASLLERPFLYLIYLIPILHEEKTVIQDKNEW